MTTDQQTAFNAALAALVARRGLAAAKTTREPSRHQDAIRGQLDAYEGRHPAAVYASVADLMTREEFEGAVWALVRAGVAFALRHDWPASCTPEQRAAMLTDGQGRYYNVLGLRS